MRNRTLATSRRWAASTFITSRCSGGAATDTRRPGWPKTQRPQDPRMGDVHTGLFISHQNGNPSSSAVLASGYSMRPAVRDAPRVPLRLCRHRDRAGRTARPKGKVSRCEEPLARRIRCVDRPPGRHLDTARAWHRRRQRDVRGDAVGGGRTLGRRCRHRRRRDRHARPGLLRAVTALVPHEGPIEDFPPPGADPPPFHNRVRARRPRARA
jgi:hypothetical protein